MGRPGALPRAGSFAFRDAPGVRDRGLVISRLGKCRSRHLRKGGDSMGVAAGPLSAWSARVNPRLNGGDAKGVPASSGQALVTFPIGDSLRPALSRSDRKSVV